jgi:hypothetical protein
MVILREVRTTFENDKDFEAWLLKHGFAELEKACHRFNKVSVPKALQLFHPDWTEEQIEQEVAKWLMGSPP